MAAFIPARHLLPRAVDAFLPARSSLDFDDDVPAHEVGYGISKAALMIDDGRGVEMAFTSQGCQWFAFNYTADDGLVLLRASGYEVRPVHTLRCRNAWIIFGACQNIMQH